MTSALRLVMPCLLGAGVLFLYADPLTAMVRLWDASPMYSYAYTVPPIALYSALVAPSAASPTRAASRLDRGKHRAGDRTVPSRPRPARGNPGHPAAVLPRRARRTGPRPVRCDPSQDRCPGAGLPVVHGAVVGRVHGAAALAVSEQFRTARRGDATCHRHSRLSRWHHHRRVERHARSCA